MQDPVISVLIHPDTQIEDFLTKRPAWPYRKQQQRLINYIPYTSEVFSQNSFWQDSDKLLHWNCSVISQDHYIVSASFTVHLYASKIQPESPSTFLFADVILVVIDDDNDYSSSTSCWVALKKILSWRFYLIYALNLLATHNLSIGYHMILQLWDPRLVNLLRLVSKGKSGWKAQKGRNLFMVLLMSQISHISISYSHYIKSIIIIQKILYPISKYTDLVNSK